MKTALCLSGGGAKGSFQVGALKYLKEQGYSFDCVSGVSVGALNGSMIAQGNFEDMFKVWETVTEKDVYLKPSWLKIIWGLLIKKKRSIYKLDPLMDLLQRHFNLAKVKIPFYMGICSLFDRKYYTKEVNDFESEQAVRDGIYASSLMPIIWEPVDVKTKQGVIIDAIDGGVKNVIPIKDIIKEGCDRIIVITCNNPKAFIPPSKPTSIIKVAEITFLEMMLDEVVENDMEGIEDTNYMVGQTVGTDVELKNRHGQPYKYVELIKIQPPVKIGSSTDFSREAIDRNFKLGYETAKEIIENLGK